MSDHDYDSAAQELNIPKSWLQKHKDELPRIEYGPTHIRFTDEHLAEIRKRHTVRPSAEQPAATAVPATLLDLRPGRAPRGRRKSASA